MSSPPKDALGRVRTRFKFNIERVKNLLTIYETLGNDSKHMDVLRAAVVLLHATLEDALRGLLGWKLPNAPADYLENIFFDQRKRNPKITVAELGSYRKLSVDDVFCQIIRSHVARVTLNNPDDVVNALAPLGVDRKRFAAKLGELAPAMERRHKIVHESDRLEPGTDHGRPRTITKQEVKAWTASVQSFVDELLRLLEKRPVKVVRKAMAAASS